MSRNFYNVMLYTNNTGGLDVFYQLITTNVDKPAYEITRIVEPGKEPAGGRALEHRRRRKVRSSGAKRDHQRQLGPGLAEQLIVGGGASGPFAEGPGRVPPGPGARAQRRRPAGGGSPSALRLEHFPPTQH